MYLHEIRFLLPCMQRIVLVTQDKLKGRTKSDSDFVIAYRTWAKLSYTQYTFILLCMPHLCLLQ